MIVFILVIVGAFSLFVWLVVSSMKQSKKDWATVRYLEDKSYRVNTKEEIEQFHKEFVEKATKIHNQYCQLILTNVDGYLRGLYKNLNQPTNAKQ